MNSARNRVTEVVRGENLRLQAGNNIWKVVFVGVNTTNGLVAEHLFCGRVVGAQV